MLPVIWSLRFEVNNNAKKASNIYIYTIAAESKYIPYPNRKNNSLMWYFLFLET